MREFFESLRARLLHTIHNMQRGDYIVLGIAVLVVLGVVLGAIFAVRPDIAESAAFAPIRNRGVLRVGVYADVEGMGYAGEGKGEYFGLEADIGLAVGLRLFGERELDVVEYVPVSNNTRAPKLTMNQADIVCATFVKDSNTNLAFSRAYFVDRTVMLVGSGAYTAPEDLAGKRIGALSRAGARTALETYFEKRNLNYEPVLFESVPDMKQALQWQKIDAFVLEGVFVERYADDGCIPLPASLGGVPYAIALRKGENELLQLCNEALLALEESGALGELIAAWGLTPHTEEGQ